LDRWRGDALDIPNWGNIYYHVASKKSLSHVQNQQVVHTFDRVIHRKTQVIHIISHLKGDLSTDMLQFFNGFLLGALISLLAWRAGSLTKSGALAATGVGALIFGLGGLPWAVLLLTFFISSSVLSRVFKRQKSPLIEKYSKGSQRDWAQVLANGGLGASFAILHSLFPGQELPWIAFAGAMAAVNADTWATELGILSPAPPRLITDWRKVERGVSGGVTLVGSSAAAAGAFLVALMGVGFNSKEAVFPFISAVVLGGLAGAFIDSYLGATVQAIYYCPACRKETERHPLHICGGQTRLMRGRRWLNNDLVNLMCSLGGSAVGVLIWMLLV
jgi:uncharacterized protein (TIGR00297 family)